MSENSPLSPPLPRESDNLLHWGSLYGSARALALANLASQHSGPLLVITPDIHLSNQLHEELRFFAHQIPTLPLPDWETLPYDHFSPHEDLISERLRTLHTLPRLKQAIVTVAMPTLMHRLLPRSYLDGHAFALSIKETLDIDALRKQLVHAGYRHAEQVLQHGEFAIRGSIIDLYPMGADTPFRIELFDDEIESIREFDPDTQLSTGKIEQIALLPAREYPLTEQAITHFRSQWRARFSGNPKDCPLYQQISVGEAAPGIEYYLPLFYEQSATLFDYLPSNTLICCINDLNTSADHFWAEVNERHEQLQYDITRPLCPPEEVFIAKNDLFAGMNQYTQIKIHHEAISNKLGHFNFATQAPPELDIQHKAKNPLNKLQTFLETHAGRILFCAESKGRREVLLDLLKEIHIVPHACESWNDFLHNSAEIGVTVARIDQGMILNDPTIALITESQLFGEQVLQRRLRKKRELDPDAMIRNLTELRIGTPVVHIDHGVGRYQGLQLLKTGDIEGEYLTLEYANDDKIYVPISSLHLISRYTGADPERAPLQKLGSKQWEKIKDKATKRVRDAAAELLDIYRRREAATGYAFKKPSREYELFRNAFPFEETPDQTQAIHDAVQDMTSARCMDRLVCGDVGFGKTEVAMQAAFVATQSNKQVVVIVPTTLLATQHGQTFQDRFADWPVNIAVLTRVQTAKEQQHTLQGLQGGSIDIVIGTHKLFNKAIKYKDLGLLIIDEEHRFGVRHKEYVKSMRAHVDILTLTATPIPRTLNMALAGTRDLSLITTPPAKRLSIKTFVHEHNPSIIREAMLRESMRGGQLYFLHNEVATINATAEKLQELAPDVRIAVAHGQMPERQLEHVMSEFYHQKYNVLVCTTIVESGIDVPTANTIIINRADRFGLAQLHQLRGRVGRSHHQAYAYLLTPEFRSMTRDAKKRLEAISELEDLGAGFHLATHDLEIRGAGELLGEEQSGQIQEVGFSLYMELLEEAVAALKSGREPDFSKSSQAGAEIDLKITALIPNDYIADVYTRLSFYKRLASCETEQDIQALKAEIIDRFGTIPEALEHLFQLTRIKLRAMVLGIEKIDSGIKYGNVHFNAKPNVDPAVIIRLIQLKPKQYQLQGPTKLRFSIEAKTAEQKLGIVNELLATLAKK